VVVLTSCGRGWAAQPPMMREAEQRTWQAIFWERASTTGGNGLARASGVWRAGATSPR
jgi:hypothetical protein